MINTESYQGPAKSLAISLTIIIFACFSIGFSQEPIVIDLSDSSLMAIGPAGSPVTEALPMSEKALSASRLNTAKAGHLWRLKPCPECSAGSATPIVNAIGFEPVTPLELNTISAPVMPSPEQIRLSSPDELPGNCAPLAASCVLGWWDWPFCYYYPDILDYVCVGFERLIPCWWPPTCEDVEAFIYELAAAMRCPVCGDCKPRKMARGIKKVVRNRFYKFRVRKIKGVSWNDFTAEIDAEFPFIYKFHLVGDYQWITLTALGYDWDPDWGNVVLLGEDWWGCWPDIPDGWLVAWDAIDHSDDVMITVEPPLPRKLGTKGPKGKARGVCVPFKWKRQRNVDCIELKVFFGRGCIWETFRWWLIWYHEVAPKVFFEDCVFPGDGSWFSWQARGWNGMGPGPWSRCKNFRSLP